MKTLEHEIIESLAQKVGVLTAANTELEIRLIQALQTVRAFEKEAERLGNIETADSAEQDSERVPDSDSERV